MDTTVRLTVAQAVVKFLGAQWTERDGDRRRAIEAMFGIFGHGNVLGIGQAIDQESDFRLYQSKNEQSMVHTALGVAKATRRMSTLACTASIGPGSTNMVTGAATATINRLPVLLLPSDTFANRRPGHTLQQLEHPIEADVSVNDAFRSVSRYFDRLTRPEQAITALPEAMRVLFDPAETGAVTLSLHQDVQGESFDFPTSLFRKRTWIVARRPPERWAVEAAAVLLRDAKRPLIIAGGGVRYSDAEAELRLIAERLGAPVAETSAGKGSLVDSEWLVGGIGVNGTQVATDAAREADVVMCVGTRLSDFTTGSMSLFQHPDVRFIAVNVDSADAHKLSALPVVADAREGLRAVIAELPDNTAGSDQRRIELTAARDQWNQVLSSSIDTLSAGQTLSQGQVIRTLNTFVEPGDWVVAAAGWQPGDLLKAWDTPAGTSTHIEFGTSCMGHEIPAALGIKMEIKDAGQAFVFIGDGSYLMNPSELFTAVQEELDIIVLVLDNGGYQSISRLALGATTSTAGNEFRQRGDTDRLPDGARVGVDFVQNAQSMGCHAELVANTAELAGALSRARAHVGPAVIVCTTDPAGSLASSGAFWDLGIPTSTSNNSTRSLSDDHVEARKAQRWHA